MSGQSLYFAARFCIPNLDGLIPTARNQPATIRAEGEAGDHVSMPSQSVNFVTDGQVPYLHSLIRTGRSQPATVWAESHRVYRLFVTS